MIPGISYDDGFLLVSPILDDGLMVFSKKNRIPWPTLRPFWADVGLDLGRQRYWPAPVEETLESWLLGRFTIQVYLKLPQGFPCN